MTTAPLRAIAHCRSGDKGNLNSLAVIAYDHAAYDFVAETIDVSLVRQHLAFRVTGTVTRYLCPALRTVHFVVEKSPRDSVTTSTFADTHGKSLSSALLELQLDVPEALLTPARGSANLPRSTGCSRCS